MLSGSGKPNIETARITYFHLLVAAKNIDFTDVGVRWVIPRTWRCCEVR